MDPDQTALMRRLVWIHAGRKRKRITLFFVVTWLIYNFNMQNTYMYTNTFAYSFWHFIVTIDFRGNVAYLTGSSKFYVENVP
jgi:hypothetical protein